MDLGVAELETDELLQPDDGVLGLHVDLVGGGASDETLRCAAVVGVSDGGGGGFGEGCGR